MTKQIATAAIACAGIALLLSQAGMAARSQATSTPKPAAAAVAQAGDSKTYRAFLDQYCVGCHNTRNPQPATHPVNLEQASLDDVLADAPTWERVLRKLS